MCYHRDTFNGGGGPMKRGLALAFAMGWAAAAAAGTGVHTTYLWHMHQPIYWPYESLLVTDANARYSYSVVDIHNQRTGPYTSWPKDAVQKGINAGMGHFGAQVSLTGSLIENLNNLEAAGKLFRVGILMNGSAPSWATLIRTLRQPD